MKIPSIKINFGIKQLLASSPTRYWNIFLLIFSVLLVLFLIFDAWIFLKFSSPSADESVIESGSQTAIIKKGLFEEVLQRIKEKEKKFNNIESNASLEILP